MPIFYHIYRQSSSWRKWTVKLEKPAMAQGWSTGWGECHLVSSLGRVWGQMIGVLCGQFKHCVRRVLRSPEQPKGMFTACKLNWTEQEFLNRRSVQFKSCEKTSRVGGGRPQYAPGGSLQGGRELGGRCSLLMNRRIGPSAGIGVQNIRI